MSVIDVSTKRRRARAVALRAEDHHLHRDLMRRDEPAPATSLPAVAIATAALAGLLAGLFLYDANRPFAFGAFGAPAQSLMISVDPMPADGSR